MNLESKHFIRQMSLPARCLAVCVDSNLIGRHDGLTSHTQAIAFVRFFSLE